MSASAYRQRRIYPVSHKKSAYRGAEVTRGCYCACATGDLLYLQVELVNMADVR